MEKSIITLFGISGNGIYKGRMKSGSQQERQALRDLLKNSRVEAGVLQSELANALGKPQSYVSKYELGEKTLDFFELRDICVHLNIPFNKVSKLWRAHES